MKTLPLSCAVSLLAVACVLAGCASRDPAAPPRPRAVDDYVRGVRAVGQGQDDRAVAVLSEAVQKNPKLTMARLVLGDLYYNKGQVQKAAEQYQALTQLDPYDSRNHYKLGLSFQVLNRMQEAAASYLRALRLNPNDGKSAMNLGLVYLALNQTSDAARWIKRSTELEPDNAAAFANLGVALDALGQYPQAEVAYRRSLELDTTQPITVLNLGSNLVLQNRGVEAAALLEQVVQKSDSALARKRLGDALALQRKIEPAVEEYRAALKLDPRYVPALNDLGRLLIQQYQQGLEMDTTKRDQAVDCWRKSLGLNANQPEIQALLRRWQGK